MKISRSGANVVVTLPGAENAVVCGQCGHLFRHNHIFSDRAFEACPRCGRPGPFRKAVEGDFAAYVERRKLKPSDYPKLVVGLVVAASLVALINWAVS